MFHLDLPPKRPGQDGRAIYLLCVALCMCCASAMLLAAEPTKKNEGVPPPKWSADDLNAFFPDARMKLVGARPDYQKAQALKASNTTGGANSAQAKSAGGWSKLIDAETIETEIKRVGPSLAKATRSPSEFKGGGYKECRREFSLLAMLFGITAEYDGDIRWQDASPTLRDLFSRAGHNCKAGSDQTYQEAVQRRQDLTDLIAGTRPKAKEAERKADWPKVADRPPLMQRMNAAHEDRLKKWLASKGEFTAHHDDVKHESQLVAAIADIIGHEGFEYSDDEKYAKWAQDLRQAAADVSAAVETDNYDGAHEANNRMTKACADCHESFRG
jgi:hypothetical protein